MREIFKSTLALVSRSHVTKKSVHRQKWSPGPFLAAKTGPPLPISVPHENVILQPSKVAS